MTEFVTAGEGAAARRIACLYRPGEGPPVVWLGGFRSDMRATKAERIDAWARESGRAFLRFDYSAHGVSPGRFEEATISRWLEDALAAIEGQLDRPPVLVGSSMGGWIALLAVRALAARGFRHPPAGLVLIAPAVDFTETLMWERFTPEIRRAIEETGVHLQPSAYSPEPYPITRALIEDGRRHLMLGAPIAVGAPVHILQGMQDPDVPWRHAFTLLEHLPGEGVSLTLVKDGDHRLSREEDLGRLIAAIEAIAPRSA